jgi:hypothetical protein
MIYPQIANLQISTKYCTTMSKSSSERGNDFYCINLNQVIYIFYICKEKKHALRTCGSLKSAKRLGLHIENAQVTNPQIT